MMMTGEWTSSKKGGAHGSMDERDEFSPKQEGGAIAQIGRVGTGVKDMFSMGGLLEGGADGESSNQSFAQHK
jgi:hypothetical protein